MPSVERGKHAPPAGCRLVSDGVRVSGAVSTLRLLSCEEAAMFKVKLLQSLLPVLLSLPAAYGADCATSFDQRCLSRAYNPAAVTANHEQRQRSLAEMARHQAEVEQQSRALEAATRQEAVRLQRAEERLSRAEEGMSEPRSRYLPGPFIVRQRGFLPPHGHAHQPGRDPLSPSAPLTGPFTPNPAGVPGGPTHPPFGARHRSFGSK